MDGERTDIVSSRVRHSLVRLTRYFNYPTKYTFHIISFYEFIHLSALLTEAVIGRLFLMSQFRFASSSTM